VAQSAALGQLAGSAGSVKSGAGSTATGAATGTSAASGNGGTATPQTAASVAAASSQTGGDPAGSNTGSGSQDNSPAGAPIDQTSSNQAAASSQDPQTSDALGLLGDPAFVQQVPVTAQGVAQTSQGAVVPPGMDQQSLAIEAVTGGNATISAGDGSLAAAAASMQGLVQPEEPSATSGAVQATLPQAASATPAEQIKVQLAKGMKDGSDSITILLHPEDLGTVEVKLQMQDGQVKANISADNPATLALLKNDAHQLQQSLQSAGFNTDSNALSFQLRDPQQQNSAFAQQQQNNGQNGQNNTTGRGTTADIVTEETLPTSVNSLGNANGGLDISV
jgi:flagellar hook-length control protein FliK